MSDVQFSPFYLNPVEPEKVKPDFEVTIQAWTPPVHGATIVQGQAPQAPAQKPQDLTKLELPSFLENQQRAQAILKQPEKQDPLMAMVDFVCAVAFPDDARLALRMEVYDIISVEILRARKLAIENYRLLEVEVRNSEETEHEPDEDNHEPAGQEESPGGNP